MEMEKEAFCGAYWHSAGAEPLPVLSSGSASDQPPQSFLNPNWKQSVTYDPDLESALSSLVSSPSSIPVPAGDGAAVGELIGSLGTICSSGEISPCSHRRSGNTSCYSTPLNSPPKLNLSVMDRRQYGQGGLQMSVNPIPSAQFLLLSADPWTEETATRKKFSRISNSKSMNACPGSRIWDPEIGNEAGKLRPPQMAMDIGDGQEESSVSDRISAEASSLRGINDSKARKRTAAAKGKGTYPSTCPLNVKKENSDAKRSKVAETNDAGQEEEAEMETEQKGGAGQKRDKINDAKPPEPPKDYIHVRARRGQATDAHSLAERVRREKISKRMKFLQDLVPGCNKVTGKAVMLDEIINYVQSLQQQVEFLSMKLATLNPQLDNVENLLSKEMYHTHGPMPLPVYNTDIASAGFPCHHQSQANPIVNLGHEPQFCLSALESSVSQSQSMQLDVLADANSQFGEFWGDELQSFAHIGFRQNQETTFSSQSFHSQMHASHMKLEL